VNQLVHPLMGDAEQLSNVTHAEPTLDELPHGNLRVLLQLTLFLLKRCA
jgi:hypothetical protein